MSASLNVVPMRLLPWELPPELGQSRPIKAVRGRGTVFTRAAIYTPMLCQHCPRPTCGLLTLQCDDNSPSLQMKGLMMIREGMPEILQPVRDSQDSNSLLCCLQNMEPGSRVIRMANGQKGPIQTFEKGGWGLRFGKCVHLN